MSDLLPSDLDIVVRVDWPRLRSNLIYARLREAISGDGLSRLEKLGPVLDDSRAVIVGLRIMSDGLHGDGILAIEAENTDVDPNDLRLHDRGPRFSRAAAPRGVSVFERRGDIERSAAALVAIAPHRGILIATPAEADALRRTVLSGADVDRLEPPARGLVSFAGRAREGGYALLPGAGGRLLQRVSEGLTGFSGTVDLSGGRALGVEVDLVYSSVAAAEKGLQTLRSATAVLESLGPAFGPIARSTRLSRRDRIVTLGAAISFDPATRLP